MAKTLTIRNLSDHDNTMLDEIRKLTGKNENSQALLAAGRRLVDLENSYYKLNAKHRLLRDEYNRLRSLWHDYTTARQRLNKYQPNDSNF